MSDAEEEKSVLLKYTCVRFIHQGKRRKVEQMDVVPTSWLLPDTQNKRKNRCLTPYMSSFDNDEDKQLLQDLVKNDVAAPQKWQVFRVENVGRAGICTSCFNFIT